ncbi:hypothetical protein FFLO_02273 [Filobasidium floriforme]|uniref:Uncharacterized protein n=1 Tax=Filobasidium floriforme TaxID=5210 RepID=A0A8K0JPW4_9TREE|nr:hypothetical protein FFLO_02273 [Filobasidium floriforme]
MVSSYPSTVLDYMEWHICQNILQKYEEKGELVVCVEEILRTIAQLEGSFPESDLSEPPPEAIEGVLGCLTMDMAEDAEDALRRRLCNEIDCEIITAEEEEQGFEATGGVTIDSPLACVQEFMRFRVVHACRSDRKTVACIQSGKEELGKSQSRNILDYATSDDVMKGIEPYLTEDG